MVFNKKPKKKKSRLESVCFLHNACFMLKNCYAFLKKSFGAYVLIEKKKFLI